MNESQTHEHVEHLRFEQEHLQWTTAHLKALAVLRRVEAKIYAHEAEIAAHRAEITRHEEALAHGAEHTPLPDVGDHQAMADRHAGETHQRLIAAILALDDLL
jgi:hypothetical protein